MSIDTLNRSSMWALWLARILIVAEPSFAFEQLQGDYNEDGEVGIADYDVWRRAFGSTGDPGEFLRGDGNDDNVVDAADYVVWRHGFIHLDDLGSGAFQAAAAPEPSMVVLAMLGMFSAWVAARRRR